MSISFLETEHPNQKHIGDDLKFPTILSSPALPHPSSLAFLTDSIKANKPFLDSLLHQTGAVLFRGFAVNSASDFNKVVEAFGFDELTYCGGAVRTQVVGRVYTANESPLDQYIPFHHEAVQFPSPPSKLFFYCDLAPETAGETPLALSHIAYERVKERYPDFIEQLEEQGLLYHRVMGDEEDPSNMGGRSWKSRFSTDDKSVAEERAAEQGMRIEWLENGAKTIAGPIQTIKDNKARNCKILFITFTFPHLGTFGNGEPLPVDVVNDCLKMVEEESVAIPWQKGDVMLIDNLAVLHARRPSSSPRILLASLCK